MPAYTWTGDSDNITWEDNGNWDRDMGPMSFPDDNSDTVLIDITSDSIVTAGAITVGEFVTTSGFSGSVTIGGAFTVDDAGGETGDFTKNGGTFSTSGSDFALNVDGDVDLTVGGTFTANASAIAVGGNWTAGSGGAFSAQSSIVTFNGTGTQTVISGGTSFNDIDYAGTSQTVVFDDLVTISGKTFPKATSTNITIKFKESVTHVIANYESKADAGSEVILDSGDGATQATINLTNNGRGTRTNISNIAVTTSELEALTARGCTDGGNNSPSVSGVGIRFGIQSEPEVNQFLTAPLPLHELTVPTSL